MKKRRTKFVLIGLATLSLAAGLAAGLLASRLPVTGLYAPAGRPVGPGDLTRAERSSLVEELNLSTAQRDELREIWEDARRQVYRTFDEAQSLQKQRDDDLISILSDEQKARFESISKHYAGRFDNLTDRRDRVFKEAVGLTKNLLDEQQRRKYDEILRSHVGTLALGSQPTTAPAGMTPTDIPASGERLPNPTQPK